MPDLPPLRVVIAILVLIGAAVALILALIQMRRRRRRPPHGIHVDLIGGDTSRSEHPRGP
jgi:hypothetical protein